MFGAETEMKLTFSCHYDQLGQKPTQCSQTERKQPNPGITFEKNVHGIDVPSRAESETAKPNLTVTSSGPTWNCSFTRLKVNKDSEHFTGLVCSSGRPQQALVCMCALGTSTHKGQLSLQKLCTSSFLNPLEFSAGLHTGTAGGFWWSLWLQLHRIPNEQAQSFLRVPTTCRCATF